MSSHARLSPSNHRWVKCPGSIREEANYPDISGDAAIDGTGSHMLLELCLQMDVTADYYKGKVIGVGHSDKTSGWVINSDRIDRVNIALIYIERRKKELSEDYPGCQIIVETESKSNVGSLYKRDDWWGTVDVTITVREDDQVRYVEVVDYKDGRMFVDCKNNPQLLAYIGGKHPRVTQYDSLRMTIVQPKTNPPIRYENISSLDLNEELFKLNQAAELTDDPDAPLIPDNKNGKGYCMWCKHKKDCSARKKQSMEVLDMVTNEPKKEGVSLFESVKEMFEDVSAMDSDTLSQMLDAKPVLEDIFKRAEQEANKRLQEGQAIQGYAMRPGNSKRQWNLEEEELVKKLKACKLKKDEIYIAKLISPAQVLKHGSLTNKQKERIEREYIESIAGPLKLSQVSREEANADALDELKQIALQCSTEKEDEVDISFLL